MKENDLHSEFIHLLKKLFGKFDQSQNKFEKASNSEISRELGYSDAQFSRLINHTATEGEYKRAIQNVERIIHLNELEQNASRDNLKSSSWISSKVWFYGTLALLISLILLAFYMVNSPKPATVMLTQNRYSMLQWTFENSFVNPYVKLDDLPMDCNFPCYKYQGKWTLKEGYKIPLFRERNGFHYAATEVVMYARCMSEKSQDGDILEGFEYQKHEIWYDKEQLPIDSFVHSGGQLKEFYQALDFNQESDFVKVATVHTFFRNEFALDSTRIIRTGKVIGRDIEFTPKSELDQAFSNSKEAQTIANELIRIVTNGLEDFSRPISCGDASLPAVDFNMVKDGDEMSFSCQLTTSRMSVDYTKTFLLADQYIKNNCQPN